MEAWVMLLSPKTKNVFLKKDNHDPVAPSSVTAKAALVVAAKTKKDDHDPHFERMLSDETMVQGLVLDDSVDEMNGISDDNANNESQNAFVTPT
eukprot:189179_1